MEAIDDESPLNIKAENGFGSNSTEQAKAGNSRDITLNVTTAGEEPVFRTERSGENHGITSRQGEEWYARYRRESNQKRKTNHKGLSIT